MSVQGTNLEDGPIEQDPIEQPQEQPAVEAATEPEQDEEQVSAVRGEDGNQYVPLKTMLAERKKAADKAEAKVRAELEAKYGGLTQQIEAIRPYAEYIRQNPGIIEQAAAGTHATAATTTQPQDDKEARDTAEDFGFYTTDGQLDVARGRRVLDRAKDAARRDLEKDIAPLRQQSEHQAATVMRQRVASLRDKQGAPVASEESLNEMFNLLPPALVANPQVAFVVAMAAAGMDKYAGRAPRVATTAYEPTYGEPIRTESVGRRGPSGPSTELLQTAAKVGLTAKDLETKYTPNKSGSIALE